MTMMAGGDIADGIEQHVALDGIWLLTSGMCIAIYAKGGLQPAIDIWLAGSTEQHKSTQDRTEVARL